MYNAVNYRTVIKVEESDDDEYEVEKIVNKRIRKRKAPEPGSSNQDSQ